MKKQTRAEKKRAKEFSKLNNDLNDVAEAACRHIGSADPKCGAKVFDGFVKTIKDKEKDDAEKGNFICPDCQEKEKKQEKKK